MSATQTRRAAPSARIMRYVNSVTELNIETAMSSGQVARAD